MSNSFSNMYKFFSLKTYFKRNWMSVSLMVIALVGSVINFWISFACMLLIICRGGRLRFKTAYVSLALMLLSFTLFYYYASQKSDVTSHIALWRSVLPFMAFLIGRIIGIRVRSEMEVFFWFFVLAFALSLSNIPITVYDIFQHGLLNPERYLIVAGDIEDQRSVTGRVVDLSLALSGATFLFFRGERKKVLVRYWVILFILASFCVIHYVSRTGIVLIAVSSIIGVLATRKAPLKSALYLFVIVVFLILLQNTSLFGLYMSREIEGSSFADAGDRVPRWLLGLETLFENPEGYVISDYYVHNFWLDYGRNGGLVAACSLFLVCLFVLIKSFRIFLAKRKCSLFYRCFILSTAVIIVLAAFTEPIHAGAPAFMWAYMVICGIITVIPMMGLERDAD